MKPNIHPDYHEITVVMTDGTSFKTRTTWGKAGDTMRLDVDRLSHPAWTGQHREDVRGGQADRFKKRYADFGLPGAGTAKKTSSETAAPAASAKPKPAKEDKAEAAPAKKAAKTTETKAEKKSSKKE